MKSFGSNESTIDTMHGNYDVVALADVLFFLVGKQEILRRERDVPRCHQKLSLEKIPVMALILT